MIINVGQKVNLNIDVFDKNGVSILNDTPKAKIKSKSTGKFFNGLFFSDEDIDFVIPHIGNGVYGFDFLSDSSDEYEVLLFSEKYEINKTLNLIVFSKDSTHYSKPNEDFIYFIPLSDDTNFVCYTLMNSDGLYYVEDTNSWNELRTFNALEKINDKLARFQVNLDLGKYDVSILEYRGEIINTEFSFLLNVSEESSKGDVVVVNSDILTYSDGTNTVTHDDDGPIAGVKISAISTVDKETKGTTISDENGEWHMTIEKGTYLFKFEKQGYTPISFIKEV